MFSLANWLSQGRSSLTAEELHCQLQIRQYFLSKYFDPSYSVAEKSGGMKRWMRDIQKVADFTLQIQPELADDAEQSQQEAPIN